MRISVALLAPDDWERLKHLRLAALKDSGFAFGATKAYEALGFQIIGDPQASSKVIGKFFLHMVREIN